MINSEYLPTYTVNSQGYLITYTLNTAEINLPFLFLVYYTFSLFPIASVSMPIIIALSRYLNINKRIAVSFKVLLISLAGIILGTFIIASVIQIVYAWKSYNQAVVEYNFGIVIIKRFGKPVLLCIFMMLNGLLLCHVLRSSLPREVRTHNNERTLTTTILIVNGCFFAAWLPHDVVLIVSEIFHEGMLQLSYDGYQRLLDALTWLNLSFYFNQSLR